MQGWAGSREIEEEDENVSHEVKKSHLFLGFRSMLHNCTETRGKVKKTREIKPECLIQSQAEWTKTHKQSRCLLDYSCDLYS